MRILITGATGFIGRTLVMRALGDDGVSEVIAPVRSAEKLRAQLVREGVAASPRLRVIEAEAPEWDFRDMGPVDCAVHCAGVLFSRSRDRYFRVNVEGTTRLLRTLRGRPRVVVLSSQSAGGPTPDGVAARKITHADRPLSWYGASKLRMELAVRELAPEYPVLLLRAPMVLGPGDQATLPLFRMVRRKIWFKPGLRLKHFSWIASEDLADGIHRWLARDDAGGLQSAQIAAPEVISDARLMQTAARVSGRQGLLLAVPQVLLRAVAFASRFIPSISARVPSLTPDRAREIWPSRWVMDGAPFAEMTGWHARATLEDTLARTLAWFRREGMV